MRIAVALLCRKMLMRHRQVHDYEQVHFHIFSISINYTTRQFCESMCAKKIMRANVVIISRECCYHFARMLLSFRASAKNAK